MRDANFLDPQLVALYDRLNPPGADTDFYVRLAGAPAKRIVDIGCGTGTLALLLADQGHQVTGIDPAEPMLAIAQAMDVRGLVEWIEGDARSLPAEAEFDLAVMTGHVFQVFLDDADVAGVLHQVRDNLRPGGRLAFETRNPAVRPWESWVPGTSRRTITSADGSKVVVEHRVLDVSGELVTFETTHDFVGGESLRSECTLRFMDQEALLGHLSAAGFESVTLLGDWGGRPFMDRSPEIVVVASTT